MSCRNNVVHVNKESLINNLKLASNLTNITTVSQKNLITYVFGFGRSGKITTEGKYADDFFYGYLNFKKNYKNINFVEFDTKKPKYLISITLSFISKIFRKLSNLPFFFESILSNENIKVLRNSENIVITSDRIGLSLIPYFITFRSKKKQNITVIVMGLLAKDQSKFLKKVFQRFFTNLFFNNVNNFIFLSKNEYLQAKVSYRKFGNKFYFIPFCVDTNFWKKNKNKEKNYVLFIGNDGRRKFDLIINIAEKLPDVEFKILTEKIKAEDIKSKNIQLIEGQWNRSLLNDIEVKNLYSGASLSVIPIKDSYQPSGQSVAMQSMSMNVPVMITNTLGFWDKDKFSHKKNIWFMNDNKLENWCDKIIYLLENDELRNDISTNGQETVDEFFSSEIFYENLKEIVLNFP